MDNGIPTVRVPRVRPIVSPEQAVRYYLLTGRAPRDWRRAACDLWVRATAYGKWSDGRTFGAPLWMGARAYSLKAGHE